MFTGLVEEVGEITAVAEHGELCVLTVRGPLVAGDAAPGDSIAVRGVCLTVVDVLSDGFTTEVMGETLARTGLGTLGVGSRVNLERALAANGRFGGHVVQGHVDGTGRVLSRTPHDRWEVIRIAVPAALTRYVVEKGSITVDGISLTVSGVGGAPGEDGWLEVSLIPTTLAATTLGDTAPGDVVNLEVDVLAKYVERLLAGPMRSVGHP